MKKPLPALLATAFGLGVFLMSFNAFRVYENVERAKAIPLGADSAQVVAVMGAPRAVEPRQAGVAYPTYAKLSYSVPLFVSNECSFEINDAGKVHSCHTAVGF